MGEDKNFRVGDTIPLDKAERTDTFYMVTIQGERYLVDPSGKVMLRQGPASTPEPPAQVAAAKPEERVHLRHKPGTPEFQAAVDHVRALVRVFMERMQHDYRALAPRLVEALKNNQAPFFKYLDIERGGRPSLMAYLIRELFSRTTIAERGLEIFEFLTEVIAIHEDGTYNRDQVLPPDKQKSLVTGFLQFLQALGDSPEKRQIMLRTTKTFLDQEYQLFQSQGGVGFYISSSRIKALKEQRDKILNEANRNYIESQYRRLVRVQNDVYQENMLAYIKALAILRLISNSRKEQRGRSEDERERLLYDILDYHPDWYPAT